MRPHPWLSGCLVLVSVLAGCRVPAPRAARPYAAAPRPPAPTKAPRWFGTGPSSEREAGAIPVLVPLERKNERSPLGVNLASLDADSAYVAFTDRFRQAGEWRSESWSGEPNQLPLDLDEEGWVRRLAEDQVAVTELPAEPGARFLVTWAGDGRLEVRGGALRPAGPRRIEVRAEGERLELRLERTSPAAPLRDIRVLPARFRGATEIPLFEPRFVERLAGFSVLRFTGWSRVGRGVPGAWRARPRPGAAVQTGPKGVAWEYILDLANQVQADAWLSVPFGADDAYVEALAELTADRLDAERRVFVEYGHEAWSPDLRRPGIQLLGRAAAGEELDPDPTIARLFYQARRSEEIFAIFDRVLGADRVVSVMSAPVGAPATVQLLLGYEDVGRSVDAVAVAPRVGTELGSPERASLVERGAEPTALRLEKRELPGTIAAIREVAKVTNRIGVALLAYEGGLDLAPRPDLASEPARAALSEVARSPESAVLTLALLDAWKAAGGQTFVMSELFGVGRPLPDLSTPAREAPRYQALLRFAQNDPRWWKQPALAPRPKPSPAPPPSEAAPVAVAEAPPPPPELYTAPWVKWASLGAGAALGALAAERFLAAEDAARLRDESIDGLSAVSQRERFDLLQDQVRAAEDERALAQGIGYAAVGLSSALVGWAIAQWLEEPPEPEVVLPPWAEGAREGGAP